MEAMRATPRRKWSDRIPRSPRLRSIGELTAPLVCPTAVAVEALRTGVVLLHNIRRRDAIPQEGETIRVGDHDDDSLCDEHVGEEAPRGSTPTPDQNSVDDMGRAYGLQEEDSGVLRSSAEVLARRDHHRMELQPTRKPLF
jgi:hypothetical protein